MVCVTRNKTNQLKGKPNEKNQADSYFWAPESDLLRIPQAPLPTRKIIMDRDSLVFLAKLAEQAER